VEYSTTNVLVMNYLPGQKLISAIKERYRAIAKQQGVSLEELKKDKINTRISASEIQSIQRKADLWDSFRNFWITLCNYTVVPILRLNSIQYKHTIVPLNIPEIIDLLIKVHGYEIFMNGCFNGDPHPGNILLLPNDQLGLIDYGQVARMEVEHRIKLAKLILALAVRNESEVFRIGTEEMGFRTKNMDPYCINKYLTIAHDCDDKEVTEGQNVQAFLEMLGKRDPTTNLPKEYIMAHRAASLLKGFGYAFKIPISIARIYEPIARDFLEQQGIKYNPMRSSTK